MSEAIITSRKVVIDDEVKEAFLVIKNGIIHDVLKERPATDLVIHDAGAKTIMPAVIDPHVHINEPGRTDWEGFETATLAALAGGIGTLVDMPLNSSPVTTTVKNFEEKLRSAENK